MRRVVFFLFGLVLLVTTTGLVTVAQRAAPAPKRPGILGGGVAQLPNGWRIAPAGRHAPVGDLPLNMVWSPDGRYLLITNNGWSKPSITIFDTTNFYIKATVPLDHAWLGLAWHPDGKRLYSSGAAQNLVNELTWNGETLKPAAPLVIGKPVLRPTFETLKDSGFVGGVSVSPDGRRLYAVQVFGTAVSLIDLERRKVERNAHLSSEPYASVVSADGKILFVSLWGGGKVLALDAESLELQYDVAVGEHPNAMLLSKDGARLFVACANTNAV
jgi:DNA-binding beta-propeller fold protein YncE